jgi:hypothetical protein
MLAFYSNLCSIASPFLNKIREIGANSAPGRSTQPVDPPNPRQTALPTSSPGAASGATLPKPEADHDHITQRPSTGSGHTHERVPFDRLMAHAPNVRALRQAQGTSPRLRAHHPGSGHITQAQGEALADLQLVAHRNQMLLHLLTGRLGITPTQHSQQPPVSVNGGTRRFKTAAVTIVNGLHLTEAGEGGL